MNNTIKVLGAGCGNCHKLYQEVQATVTNLGLPATVEYINDIQALLDYQILSQPGLIINEQIISQGKVYKAKELAKLLPQYLNSNPEKNPGAAATDSTTSTLGTTCNCGGAWGCKKK